MKRHWAVVEPTSRCYQKGNSNQKQAMHKGKGFAKIMKTKKETHTLQNISLACFDWLFLSQVF